MEEVQKFKNTPKDVFVQLLAIVTLYIGVISFIALLFQYINVLFPDQLEYYSRFGAFDVVRRSMAALIVVWPVYLIMMYFIAKNTREQPERKHLGIRKWLTYLTLFVAAITIIIDLIILINAFLGGELTSRFILKIIVVLFVAAAVFGFYLWDLRKTETKIQISKILAWGISAVLLISIASGFFIVGTPKDQRMLRFDQQRVNDLQTIQNQIVYNNWQQKGFLPKFLDELKDDIAGFRAPVDPESGAQYEYRATGNLSFELCAVFFTSNQDVKYPFKTSDRAHPIPVQGDGFDTWEHEAGRSCFIRTIDPVRYPVQKDNQPTVQTPMISVTNPKPDQEILSPLTIFGEARGSWFFEATFPIELQDAQGNTIAQHYAEAQSDWMTQDFVPFVAKLEFEISVSDTTGTLILHKHNASGLPEHNDSVSIPVTFYHP